MEQEESLGQLANLSLLREMPGETRRGIGGVFLAVSEEIELEDGEAMMREGYLAFESGYVLLNGTVVVEKEGVVLSEIAAPALLGEMSQFKSSDMRTATVKAKGPVVALQFDWDEFYSQLKADLHAGDHALFMRAMELLVWERFRSEPLLDLALFRGLNSDLRLKVCLDFPWITERAALPDGEVLFKTDDRCQNTGYLIMKGSVKVSQGAAREHVFQAPNIIGIMPKPDPALTWTATAVAMGPVELLYFNWKTYTTKLQQRLSVDEQNALIEAMRRNAAEHFWH